MTKSTSVPIDKIHVDHKFQIRVAICAETVNEYAESYSQGAKLPPLDIFKNGEGFLLADGFHRINAAKQAGLKLVDAVIHLGGPDAIIKLAIAANSRHGQRLSNADKRKIVKIALEQWPKLSDRALAEICVVGHAFVSAARKAQLSTVDSSISASDSESTKPSQPAKRVGRDGKARSTVPKEDKKATEIRTDKTGYPIPENLLSQWDRATNQAMGWIRAFDAIHRQVMEVHGIDFAVAKINKSTLESDHVNYRQNLKQALPYAVCPTCQGVMPERCKTCNPCKSQDGEKGFGLGWVNKTFWVNAVPEEFKKVRAKAYGTNAS